MDTRLLLAFVTLAETKNYREAAQRLFITQPALTKQIKTLESQCGVALFARGRHGATLTRAGKLLLEKSRELVAQADALRRYAQHVAGGKHGELTIGFGISGIKIAPALVARFRRRYPEVNISLEDMSSVQQTEQLLSGQLQLAFMRLPVMPPLTGLTLFTESLVLAINKKSLLALPEMPEDVTSLLSTFPLIQFLPGKGPGLYQQINRFLQVNNLTPKVVQQSQDLQTLLALVSAGVGIALMPERAVHIAQEDIEMLPLSGPHASWEVGMVWNTALNDATRDMFIGLVHQWEPDSASNGIGS